MENSTGPSRTKRKLGVGLVALVIVGVAACSHHHNNSTVVTNNTTNTTNNMENNMTENATADVFGSTFATDFGAPANSNPANVSANDITAVSATTNPVPVNSTGAASTTGT